MQYHIRENMIRMRVVWGQMKLEQGLLRADHTYWWWRWDAEWTKKCTSLCAAVDLTKHTSVFACFGHTLYRVNKVTVILTWVYTWLLMHHIFFRRQQCVYFFCFDITRIWDILIITLRNCSIEYQAVWGTLNKSFSFGAWNRGLHNCIEDCCFVFLLELFRNENRPFF